MAYGMKPKKAPGFPPALKRVGRNMGKAPVAGFKKKPLPKKG
jgi:hypothetical protein